MSEEHFQQSFRQNPPQFDSETQSFERFLRSLNDFLNANSFDLKDGIRLLPLLLDETCRDLYDTLSENLRKSGPWDELTTQLQDIIYPKEKKALFRQQLLMLKQAPGETVSAFGTKCVNLSQMAYPGQANLKQRDTILFSAFLQGLHGDLARSVYRDKAENFTEAKPSAEQEEALQLLVPKPQNYDNLKGALEHISALLQRSGNDSDEEDSDASDASDHSDDTTSAGSEDQDSQESEDSADSDDSTDTEETEETEETGDSEDQWYGNGSDEDDDFSWRLKPHPDDSLPWLRRTDSR